MAHRHATFENHHHHHHHHEHVEYRRPHSLNTDLGLFALKKLNAINPDILTEQDKRLLNPVAPGVISFLINGSLAVGTTVLAATTWARFGMGGFLKPQVAVGLVGFLGASYVCN